MEQVGSSDTDDSVREIDEEAETCNQLLRSSSYGPGSPNNVIRNEVTRYVKDKLEPQRRDPLVLGKQFSLTPPRPTCPDLFVSASFVGCKRESIKVAKNVVGDTRLRLKSN